MAISQLTILDYQNIISNQNDLKLVFQMISAIWPNKASLLVSHPTQQSFLHTQHVVGTVGSNTIYQGTQEEFPPLTHQAVGVQTLVPAVKPAVVYSLVPACLSVVQESLENTVLNNNLHMKGLIEI